MIFSLFLGRIYCKQSNLLYSYSWYLSNGSHKTPKRGWNLNVVLGIRMTNENMTLGQMKHLWHKNQGHITSALVIRFSREKQSCIRCVFDNVFLSNDQERLQLTLVKNRYPFSLHVSDTVYKVRHFMELLTFLLPFHHHEVCTCFPSRHPFNRFLLPTFSSGESMAKRKPSSWMKTYSPLNQLLSGATNSKEGFQVTTSHITQGTNWEVLI